MLPITPAMLPERGAMRDIITLIHTLMLLMPIFADALMR